jgi:hypothetical protein
MGLCAIKTIWRKYWGNKGVTPSKWLIEMIQTKKDMTVHQNRENQHWC